VHRTPDLLIIGSSTGGPKALLELFGYINIVLPYPTVIVNHFPKGDFTHSFCRQLKDKTNADIKEAQADERLMPGKIYLCPGGLHISLRTSLTGIQVKLDDEPHIDGCKPSVDKLFQSATKLNLNHILALVLTGMGHDGCLGAKALKAAKHTVYTQSKASCTIYGMPMEVDKAGCSDGSFDLREMARKICSSPRAQQSKKIESPLAAYKNLTLSSTTGLAQDSFKTHTDKVAPSTTGAPSLNSKKITEEGGLHGDRIRAPLPLAVDLKISPTDILLLQDVIVKKTGNNIYTQSKEYLLIEKVKTFAQKHHLATFYELLNKLKFNSTILEDFISSITIHESFFFRDLYPYRYLKEVLFPEWEKNLGCKTLWSSACANGQEIYSMLFSLGDYLRDHTSSKLNFQNIKFYASDISKSCVDFSSEAIYSSTMTRRGLTTRHLGTYFEDLGAGQFRVKDAWRSMPNFKSLNLLSSLHAIPNMDCIFCRYTLIYFSEADQQCAINALVEKLKPNGILILDPAISLRVSSPKLIPIAYERFTLFKKKS